MKEMDPIKVSPVIRTSVEKKLVGHKLTTNYMENRVAELWRGFMPLRKTIKGQLSDDLFSVQVYTKQPDPVSFDPSLMFDRWAAVEVISFTDVPEGMHTLVLPAGTYAVFEHKGANLTAEAAFRYFYQQWLPSSGYQLDDRPHFEILGARYKNNDPDSEEEVWVPVKPQ